MKRNKQIKEINEHIIWMRATLGSWVITRAHEEAALIMFEGQAVASHHRAAAHICDDHIANCKMAIQRAEGEFDELVSGARDSRLSSAAVRLIPW
jgi:hypothetical protein